MMMGANCSAVSLRTLAGSSSGPVSLFWFEIFQFFNYPVCANIKRGACWSTMKDILSEWGIFRW